jgi:predicted nucleic acid-binding protein
MVFLDSNIWLYALLPHQDIEKASSAKSLLKHNQADIALSSQVVIEVSANLLRKGKFTEPQIAKFIKDAYQNYLVIDVSETVLLMASELRAKHSLSYFDSIIVSAAVEVKATILYSEDMRDGLLVENQLTITNPFVHTP